MKCKAPDIRENTEPDVLEVLPVLRRAAFEKTRCRATADDIVEHVLLLAIAVPEHPRNQQELKGWLLRLLNERISGIAGAFSADNTTPYRSSDP